ncbi:MAG: SDR family NAD(P)-dependent oxidoreductase [Deltaproteobacteria bacterium]
MSGIEELFGLNGRVAVVTGASSGLGVGFARALAQAGANLVLAARRADRLESLGAELSEAGAEVLPVACDVTDPNQVEALKDACLERFGRADILVNNAGTTEIVPAENESEEAFLRVLNVNLNGTFYCAQRFGRVMLEAGQGSIINVASILGLVGSGSIPQAGYVASKGAVVNLTRELAAQWARRGVRVNGIAPGFFKSEMTEEMFSDERSMSWLRRKTPAGRPGEVEELYGAVIYLASDASSYVTGQTIAVDGGWTAI